MPSTSSHFVLGGLSMPSTSSHFVLGGLSISQIQKYLPKKWKQHGKQMNGYIENNQPLLEALTIDNESMIDRLFNSLKAFATQGHLLKAFQTFSLIQLHATSRITYHELFVCSLSSLLLSCISDKLLPQGQQLHAQIICLGFEQHPILLPKLVNFYSTINLFDNAYAITENSNILHPLAWNILISSCVRNGLFGKALYAYRHMVSKGIRPDNFTYPSVLKACAEKLDLAVGREVHESIAASKHGWNLFVHNSLVSMYGKIGELNIARQLFDKMPERDAVSWNAIISAYASKGMWKEAFELFEAMREGGIELNIITWNTIAGGCLRTGNFNGALELLSRMRYCGSHLDSVALLIGLSACSHTGAIKLGREIHGFGVRNYLDGFDNLNNALITMYSRCNDLRHAHMLFQMIKSKSIITWNCIISGYAHMDRYEDASFLFREMLDSGVELNYVTIASILPLCARVANLQHGKEFHCYVMRRAEFDNYLLLWNALVDVYARSGKVLEAKKVFDSMKRRDEVTYTSLIAAYGTQGDGQAALRLFDDMNKYQIKPDHVTMVAILSACSHSGLVNEGKMLFEKIYTFYGIVPRLEHFACLADLFGRAGLLQKANEIITKMPYRPTSSMWATLLGACRIHGDKVMGEWVAEKLLEMRPKNSGYYVLISNVYAAAGCWDKLAKVRTFMRNLGVRKDPGCAWVDVGSGFLPFLVGDTSQPHAKELHALLDRLTELMKDVGYVDRKEFISNNEQLEEIDYC